MRSPRAFVALVAVFGLLIAAQPVAGAAGNTWVSLDANGNQFSVPSGAYSYPPAINDDGGLVAFESMAPLAGSIDKNNLGDVYVRDLNAKTVELVSVSPDGGPGNERSSGPSMSGDGQFVAFASLGSNLSPSDANNQSDVFLRDRSAGTTTRVSVGTGGSDADGSSYRPSISGDGSFVAFCSRASNLVADDTNGVADAFLWERTTGAITRIPVPGTTQAASDGCLSVSADNDGGVVAFSAVTGGTAGVFVYDRASGSTTAVTDGADGPSGTGGVAISGDGGVVIFDSLADNLVDNDTNRSRDVFARDRAAGTMSRVSVRSSGSQLPGDSGASGVGVSRDGRFAVFGSTARGVVQGDTNGFEDVFRRDLTSGETTIVSVNATDLSANNPSYSPAVNADGSQVVYTSLATNVVTGDGNRQPDVFVRGGTFPDRVGTSTEPEDTGAPQESDQTVVVGQDDGGLPRALLIGGIALGLAVVLAGGWLLLGRRGRA